MKKVNYFLGLLFVLLGCSSDNESVTNSVSIAILVKKAVTSSLVFEYNYNGNKFTEFNIGNNKIVHTYTGNLITNIKRYNLGSSELEFENRFTYDANQKLIEEVNLFYSNNTAEKRVYTYNNDIITFQVYSGNFLNQNTIGNSGIIYKNTFGDVAKVENYNGANLLNKTEYTYDSKNSIFKNALGYDKLVSIFESGKVNNITSSTTFNDGGDIINQYNNIYTYNSSNFPIAVTTSFIGSTSTSTTEYNY